MINIREKWEEDEEIMNSEKNLNEDAGGGSALNVQLEVKDPSICPCGNQYSRCKTQACIDEMCEAEAAAYCPHGFLAGCPTCTSNAIITGRGDAL